MKDSVSEAVQALVDRAGIADLLTGLIDGFPYPIQLYAPDGLLMAVNPAFLQEFSIPHPSLIVGYNILRDPTLAEYGVTDEVRAAFEGRPARVLGIPAPVHKLKKWFQLPAGEDAELFYLNIHSVSLKDDQGNLVCVAIVYVTQRKLLDRAEIARAKEYMQEHWLEKFDMQAVAKAALMSPTHFERRFKACTGMTPHAYYAKLKVEKLKEALLDADRSIEEAFLACGFQYHGHYARLFKAETGLTPSAYRKSAGAFSRK